MRLLLISNSTNPGEAYLDYPKIQIKSFLGNKKLKALFIPYAAVTISFDEYEAKVKERFDEIGHDVISIHRFSSPMEAVKNAEAIVIGGGNTFCLLKLLQQNNLIAPIRERVLNGLPYVGWSAGANMACPAISTTNDMPIVTPDGFAAFHLVPFQINPHYTDIVLAGHGGETRDDRINEYLLANPEKVVIGLREGTILWVENHTLRLIGHRKAKVFRSGDTPVEVATFESFNFFDRDK
jgi:dipeptidase E